MNAIEIHQEVIALLQAWGYKPEVKVNKPASAYIDICFPVKNGFDTMPTRHKTLFLCSQKAICLNFITHMEINTSIYAMSAMAWNQMTTDIVVLYTKCDL